MVLISMMKSHTVLLHPAQDMNYPFVQCIHTIHPDSHLVAFLIVMISTVLVFK